MVLVLWGFLPKGVFASDTQEKMQKDIMSEFDFGELESYLDEQFPNQKLSFSEMLEQLISGDTKITFQEVWKLIASQFAYEFQHTKGSIISLLLIVIIASIFRNFSGVFKDSQVSEIGFLVLYLLLITICLNSFQVLSESVVAGLGTLLGFLQLLAPVYFLSVAIATGSSTSIAFYTIILLLICIVEILIQSIVIPLVELYMMLRVLNNLSQESYLSKFGELLHTVIVWGLRALLAGVIGINLIQSLLNPAIDSVKRGVLTKGGEAIPIIGDLVGGTAEVMLGTAKLIKNGIGAAGAVICVSICMAPVIQMIVVTLLYKLTAALVQPISDKRIVGTISCMADGATILLRVLLTSSLLFLITIAMVANTTA